MTQTNLFKVYLLCRPDGSPFYVGKDGSHRLLKHLSEARCGHRCYKCHVIRKIWRTGGEVSYCVVLTTHDEVEAYAEEARQVALIGRANLTNRTDGGGGVRGRDWRPSLETRAKSSASHKRRLADPIVRRVHVARMKTNFSAPEAVAKKRASLRERAQLSEVRLANSTRIRALWARPDVRAKFEAAWAENFADPEWIEARAEKIREYWADPEARETHSIRMTAYFAAHPKSRAVACRKGHPYGDDTPTDVRGVRYCRICAHNRYLARRMAS